MIDTDTIDGANVLPGYTLSKLGPVELGELESHFRQRHLSEAVAAAKTTEAAQVLTATAMKNNSEGVWRHGTLGFQWAASEPANLPKILAVALRRHHPSITEADTAKLITTENAPQVHCLALLACRIQLPNQ